MCNFGNKTDLLKKRDGGITTSSILMLEKAYEPSVLIVDGKYIVVKS